jgi:uncharacterized lipoprotein
MTSKLPLSVPTHTLLDPVSPWRRCTRPILFGAVALALLSAGGCRWFKHKDVYAQSPENRPLEVPPDLSLPNTASATPLPTAAGLGGTTASNAAKGAGFTVNEAAAQLYPRVGTALATIEGVVVHGRAEALRSYDVGYQGQSFLIRVEDSQGGSRVSAISASGQALRAGPASQLLVVLQTKL